MPDAAGSIPRSRPLPNRSRLLAAAFVLAGTLAPLSATAVAQTQTASNGPVLVFDVKGVIGFTAVDYLNKSLQRARAEKASLIVMRIDTPGGLVSSTRDMIQAILGSQVPIIGYVAPSGARAASAGTYLMFASHLAAMAPATHLGAATPIQMGAPGPLAPPRPAPDDMKKDEPDPSGAAERKIINDAVAYLRGLAELRKRNADWAEKAVREGSTLTASQALKENVIEIVAGSVPEVLTAADGRTVQTAAGPVILATAGRSIIEMRPSWHMQVLQVIADPNVAFLLLLIGMYGIIFELLNPGALFPGVIGGISLVLALTALTVLPVNLGGLLLLLIGVGLMAAEAFSPGFGVLGLGGIVAFVLGGLFMFDPGEVDIAIGVSWPLVVGSAIASVGLLTAVVGMAVKARHEKVRTGSEELIGSLGEVVSWSDAGGRILVHGEIWAAKADTPLAPGKSVRVVGRTGLTLHVTEAS